MDLPDEKMGVVAFGIKTGLITEDDDLDQLIITILSEYPELLRNGDILCITEAVVAITQRNYVHLSALTAEFRRKLNLPERAHVGVLFPILSRNRFSMILQAIAATAPGGKISVQLSFPCDEQGNQIIDRQLLQRLGKQHQDQITLEEIGASRFLHPETGIDYIDLYEKIIRSQGAEAEIFLANHPKHLIARQPHGIVVSNVHGCLETWQTVHQSFKNAITLMDVCSDPAQAVYSEYGVLGSNYLNPEKNLLKLAPRESDRVCERMQRLIADQFHKEVEVLVYGDGAYKDPETGIYELADPLPAFGTTAGIRSGHRRGVKTKFLMQKLYNEGKTREEISQIITQERQKLLQEAQIDTLSAEGTTPRRIKNLVASLADLVSGSADANTPIVIVRGFLD